MVIKNESEKSNWEQSQIRTTVSDEAQGPSREGAYSVDFDSDFLLVDGFILRENAKHFLGIDHNIYPLLQTAEIVTFTSYWTPI